MKTLVCVLCHEEYQIPKHLSSYAGLCPTHWSKDTLREWDRWEQARNLCPDELPCTLTLPEWMQVIADWRGQCALCGCSYFNVLAIWRPEQGLTAQNVVPLCKSCAHHKKHGFSTALKRVEARLQSNG